MLELDYYRSIPSFPSPAEMTELSNFYALEGDWYIVVTDVKGSTIAIQEGRYKEVNMVGASSIALCVNALGSFDFPFVFGGDGATILIPSSQIKDLSLEFEQLQKLAKDVFQLDLRIGMVELAYLFSKGFELAVGKLELSPGNHLAQFIGNALGEAELLVKQALPPAILIDSTHCADQKPKLEGLSCRLEPLKAENDLILSILFKPKSESTPIALQHTQSLMASIYQILATDKKNHEPVSLKKLDWRILNKTAKYEAEYAEKSKFKLLRHFRRYLISVIVNLSLKLDIPLGPFQPSLYKKDLVSNSDSKKFDEMLRMIVDCTKEQAIEIENLLQEKYKEGVGFFGIHRSAEAILTCIVQSATENKHIHFVDGSHGGYALASMGLKRQIKEHLVQSVRDN